MGEKEKKEKKKRIRNLHTFGGSNNCVLNFAIFAFS